MAKTNKRAKKRSVSTLRKDKHAPALNTLMRRLKHVKPAGPYTRDEMNER